MYRGEDAADKFVRDLQKEAKQLCDEYIATCRRGAVVKGVEHISTVVLVNILVARVRVPLVLSVGI